MKVRIGLVLLLVLVAAFTPPFLVEPKLAFLYTGLTAQFVFTLLFVCGVLLLKGEFEWEHEQNGTNNRRHS